MPKIKPNKYPVQDATLSALCQKFEAIRQARGTNAKKLLLEEYKTDDLFNKTLYFLLNPLITTGISKNKVKKKVAKIENCWVPFRFEMLLDYIRDHNTGKDEDIIVLQKYMANNPIYMDFIKDIVTKSYKLGVNTKIVDSIYGDDFLQVWTVQQAYPLEKYQLQDGEWFSLSQKLNGFHASYYKGKLISRQGKEITGCQHIIHAIEHFGLQNYFIDGELIRKNDDAIPDEENFRLTVSIANSDIEDKSDLQFIYKLQIALIFYVRVRNRNCQSEIFFIWNSIIIFSDEFSINKIVLQPKMFYGMYDVLTSSNFFALSTN